MATKTPPSAADNAFEHEKWEKETEFRRREVEVKELEVATKNREVAVREQEASIKDREQRLKNRELRLKLIELRKSRFTNPVFLAIVGATVTAAGTAVGAWYSASAQQTIERLKADSALFVEVIKTGEKEARNNLQFLVDNHLINDETRRTQIQEYLASSKPIPTLPPNVPTLSDAQGLSVTCKIPQDVDVPTIAAAIEKNLSARRAVSTVQTTVAADSAAIVVELTVSSGGNVCPGGGPRSGKLFVTIRKASGAIAINFDIAIPRLLLVAFSANMPTDFVAGLTKMLESTVGAGKVTCVQA
jgi:hypothetical protein